MANPTMLAVLAAPLLVALLAALLGAAAALERWVGSAEPPGPTITPRSIGGSRTGV